MNLNQVTVPSINVEKSIRFYELLGLRLIVKALPHYARFECKEGNATFSVHQVKELPKGEGVYVYFETEKLEEEVERLQDAGIQFDLLPTDQSWLWKEARLTDPDHNTVILYFAGDHRKNPPWRIN